MPNLVVWDPTKEFLEFIEKSNFLTEKITAKRCKVVNGYTESYEIISQILVRDYPLGSFDGIVGVSATYDGEPFEYMYKGS